MQHFYWNSFNKPVWFSSAVCDFLFYFTACWLNVCSYCHSLTSLSLSSIKRFPSFSRRCPGHSRGSAPSRPFTEKRQHGHANLQHHRDHHRSRPGSGALAALGNPWTSYQEGARRRDAKTSCSTRTQTDSFPNVQRCFKHLHQPQRDQHRPPVS